MLALAGLDDDCLQVMADEFQSPCSGWMDHMYWEELESMNAAAKYKRRKTDDEPSCAIM